MKHLQIMCNKSYFLMLGDDQAYIRGSMCSGNVHLNHFI